MKRMLQMTLAAIMLTIAGTAAALAGEVEATIVEIRPDASVMVLSDGQTYSIPVDFFVDDQILQTSIIHYHKFDTVLQDILPFAERMKCLRRSLFKAA